MNLQTVKQRFAIIGRSAKLDRALSTAVRVASTDLTVLIQGESGVGKEVFSQIIHNLSARKHNKIIAINCGAIPEGTINSELFGHEKGSFTGASAERKGYFETVNGGTIFLDEIGEMPLDTQAFLLRILESGEFIRVGSSKMLKTDVRVIAATNIDLETKIRAGKFREDLYYRLNTVPIRVPSLKERREDIYMLFRKFAGDFAEKYRTSPIHLDDQAVQIIESYPWPGNVRELKNVVEQISVLSENSELSSDDLIDLVPNLVERRLPMKRDEQLSGDSYQEREILYKLLFDMKGDLNDLKSLVFELIRTNDLDVPNMPQLKQFASNDLSRSKSPAPVFDRDSFDFPDTDTENPEYNQAIIISPSQKESYQKSEIVEENLSLETMEREMITKALKKYKGRRRDAADELGISERTLYRKIKEYELQ